MKYLYASIIASLFALSSLVAQEQWSLEKCILQAQQQSLAIQQAQVSIDNEKISLQQNENSRYPLVNANSNLGVNLGRSVNYATNSISTQTIFQHSLGINSSVAIYQGGRVKKAIEQNKVNIKANELDLQQTQQNIALQVAQAYLQVLLSLEQVEIAKKQLQQTQEQVTRMNKLIRAGVMPKGDKLELDAQIARGEQAIANAQNGVDISYLNLKQLLMLDLQEDIKVEVPPIQLDESIISSINLENIYQQALLTQPNIQAGELRLQSADLSKDIAKAGKLPTITLSGGINTAYSSAAQEADVSNTNVSLDTIALPLLINGTAVPAQTIRANAIPSFKNINYFKQFFNQNLGGNIGVGISYPIWDNRTAKLQEERASLQKVSQQIQNEQLKQQLKMDIQNAYISAVAAQKNYASAKKTLEVQKLSYQNIQKKFKIGSATTFEINTARNSIAQAENELTRSKYEYIFRLKILDFYAGKPIALNK